MTICTLCQIHIVSSPNENTCTNCTKAFEAGARYAIEYFRDEVYGDGVMDTDIWADYFGAPEEEEE